MPKRHQIIEQLSIRRVIEYDEICPPNYVVRVGAMIMRIRFLSCRVLVVFALVPVACLADARSKPSPSEIYPGPWLEITQEVRDTLTLRKVSACNEAVGRQSSVDSGNIFCIALKTRLIGQAGSLSRRRKGGGPGTLLDGIPLPDTY